MWTIFGSDVLADQVFTMMHQAKLGDHSGNLFMTRGHLPEPAFILACDRQLDDLVRFCTPFPFLQLIPYSILVSMTSHQQHTKTASAECAIWHKSHLHWPYNDTLLENIPHIPVFCSNPNWFTQRASRVACIWDRCGKGT